MASWSTPTAPAVGAQAAASWADTVSADLALIASPAYFYATMNISVALTTGVNFDFAGSGSIVEDSLGGWNSTNKNYVVKSPGLYLITMGLAASAFVSETPLVLKNGTLLAQGPIRSASSAGDGFAAVYRFALNDTIAMRTSAAYTTNVQPNLNFITLAQLSWV